jgi:hypothetical protein
MTLTSAPESTQGLLDLDVELSTSDITAGNEFTIFVLVKNPFSKPVWIQEVNVSLPSDLQRLDDKESERIAKEAESSHQHAIEEKERTEKLEASIESLGGDVREVIDQLKSNPASDISRQLNGLEFEVDRLKDKFEDLRQGESRLNIIGSAEIGQIKIGSHFSKIDLESKNEDQQTPNQIKVSQIEVYEPWLIHEQQTLSRTVSLKSSLPANTALLPGSTAVYTVILNVKRSLVFTPTKYRLQFYVNYSFVPPIPEQSNQSLQSDSVCTNTIAHTLSIRPSVYSVIIGSTFGAAIGATARLLQATTVLSLPSIVVSLILSIILGGVAIIFMARKSDTQSFVSVEDFWGGILIGFLVGYTGVSFFEGITGTSIPK